MTEQENSWSNIPIKDTAPSPKPNLKVVIYSSNGSANYDVRIQSQATFLKSQGHTVTVVEPVSTISAPKFDWENNGINYFCEKNDVKALKLLEEAIALLRASRARLVRPLTCKLFLSLVIAILRLLAKAIEREVRRSLFHTLCALQPHVIITRDVIPEEVFWYKKRFPTACVLSDLHEVVFWQQDTPDITLRSKQLTGFKIIAGAICVTEQIRENFYLNIGKPVLVIPNLPSSTLCHGITFQSRSNNENTVFLIHGGYLPQRDFLVDAILEAWKETPETAILCVRVLQPDSIQHLARRYGRMARIHFLPPIYGGFREELKETAGLFDIGILPSPVNLSPMYDMCSPNRLALYLHAGLGLLHTPSSFVKKIAANAKAGVQWDGVDLVSFINIVEDLSTHRERTEMIRGNAFRFAKRNFQYECFGRGLLDLIESSVS
jgi:glycosyltransferase involved in cell wall biosynthesis